MGGVVAGGYEALQGAMVTKFLKENMAKYTSMRKLSEYSLTIFSGPVYAWSFDAKATTYLPKVLPVLLSLAFRAVEWVAWFHPRKGAFKYMDHLLDLLGEEREK